VEEKAASENFRGKAILFPEFTVITVGFLSRSSSSFYKRETTGILRVVLVVSIVTPDYRTRSGLWSTGRRFVSAFWMWESELVEGIRQGAK
jgi:hypothetical protein